MKKDEGKKLILKGVFQKFAPVNYPYRIYGEYEWDWIEYKWVKNKKFLKDKDEDSN